MFSLRSNIITRTIASFFCSAYMGLMIYSSISALSNPFNLDRELPIICIVLYGLVFIYAAVGRILKSVLKKYIFETLIAPIAFSIITLVFAYENFCVTINLINFVCGSLAIVVFVAQLVAIIMFVKIECRKGLSKYAINDKLPKGLFTGGNILMFGFAILALIGSIESYPLAIVQVVIFLITPITLTIDVWTIHEDMHVASSPLYDSKVKANIKKISPANIKKEEILSTEANTTYSPEEAEALINKKEYSLNDFKTAKKLFEQGKLSAQDYENIKRKYISSL